MGISMCINFDKMINRQIIQCYSKSIKELKKRNIIITENIDVISTKGERYSITTIVNNGVIGVFYRLPPLGSSEQPEQKFEYVIIMKLTDSFKLERILELTWDEFLENKKWHSRMKAWNLSYSNKLISSVLIIYSKEGKNE